MAKNQDSFDMDKWSKGKKEKAEKPVKEKKEKETSFDMDDSGSFSMDKHTKKEKKEKVKKEKPILEDNNASFAVESKGKFDIKNAFKTKGKDGNSKEVKLDESGEFDTLESKSKKKVNTKLIILISAVTVAIILAAAVIFGFVIPNNERHAMEIASIEIDKVPNKVVYFVGDEPDYTGLRVRATRNNGEVFFVRADQCEFVGFDSQLSAQNQIITVKYGGCSDIFSVKINEEIKVDPILTGIRLEPMPKTEYKVGERLNVDGVYVVREYLDGSEVKVNLMKSDVKGWTEAYYSGVGTYTLTVSYTENDVTVYTTFDITITE